MPPETPQPWIRYRCPDCEVDAEPAAGTPRCPRCGRLFHRREGILYMLPRRLEHAAVKEREKAGWRSLGPADLERQRGHYLALPFSEEHLPHFTHYREAARQFRLAAAYLEPLAGKRGLDLGGSIGWAAHRFGELGASMALTDFNDDAVAGLGGARVYLEAGASFERLCADAERLPLAGGQFDFVFCCAFLHHLPDPARVVRHVARVLRPGGVFIAASEAFCPLWTTRKQALARCQMALDFIHEGVNEQVFYASEYARWFARAGLRLKVVNPRWDEVLPGRVRRNRRLAAPGYAPEILANRLGRPGMAGAAARLLHERGLWRPLAHPALFPLLRPLLLAGTQKFRLLIGIKPK